MSALAAPSTILQALVWCVKFIRFEILPLVLYFGISAHFMVENCISRFKTWSGCLSGYRRKGYFPCHTLDY